MSQCRVTQYKTRDRFDRDLRKAPPDIQKAALAAIDRLISDGSKGSLRPHALSGYNPKVFKIDVRADHSWQISYEIEGETAILRRLATHSVMDRAP